MHPVVDWQAVERDYRANILTNTEVVTKHGVASGPSLCNKAKREGWTRDLAPRIAREVERQLLDAALDQRPGLKAALDANGHDGTLPATARQLLRDVTFVSATATVHTELVQRHRADLRNAAELATGLLSELRVAGLGKAQLTRLLNAARRAESISPDEWASLMGDIRALTSSTRRTSGLATVVGTIANLQQLERQAYGLRPFETPKDDPAAPNGGGGASPTRKGVRIEFADVPHRDVQAGPAG